MEQRSNELLDRWHVRAAVHEWLNRIKLLIRKRDRPERREVKPPVTRPPTQDEDDEMAFFRQVLNQR